MASNVLLFLLKKSENAANVFFWILSYNLVKFYFKVI